MLHLSHRQRDAFSKRQCFLTVHPPLLNPSSVWTYIDVFRIQNCIPIQLQFRQMVLSLWFVNTNTHNTWPHLLWSGTGLPGLSPPRWLCWGAVSPRRRGLCWSTEWPSRWRWEPAGAAPSWTLSHTYSCHQWPLPDFWPPPLPPSHSALQLGSDPQWMLQSLWGVCKESLW